MATDDIDFQDCAFLRFRKSAFRVVFFLFTGFKLHGCGKTHFDPVFAFITCLADDLVGLGGLGLIEDVVG